MENVIAVVVTHNRKKLLIECLKAILSQTFPLNRIVVIDNNSNDGTGILFKKGQLLDNKVICYQYFPDNLGGAGGFYEGIKYASRLNADWLWVMDDDTIPLSDSLENLIKDKNVLNIDNLSFVASSVFGPNHEAMNVPTVSRQKSTSGYPDWYFELNKGLIKVESATFVSLLINNTAITSLGLPVKNYFIWGDDTEYTLRLTHFFGPAYFSGNSQVIHKRANIKILNIKFENNINRIPLYFYLVRNTLITKSEYYGKKVKFKELAYWIRVSLSILIEPKIRYRFKKILVIQKGILSYLFKRYDYKGFSNRMNHD